MRAREASVLVGLAIGAVAVVVAVRQQSPPGVTLAWDASLGTNIIRNYRVYWGVASRTYTNSQLAGTNLTTTINGLQSGVTYYFAATAIDTDGLESDYSGEAVLFSRTITVVTVKGGATNIARAPQLSGPWTLVGTTNLRITNATGRAYFRGVGRSGNTVQIRTQQE